MSRAPKGGGSSETLGASAAVVFEFAGSVLRCGEVVECVKDVGKNLGSDVSAPEEVEVFIVGDFGGDGGGWQLA